LKDFTIFVIVLVLLLMGSAGFAAQKGVIGGIRSGAALGLMMESGLSNSAMLRFGFEANTSNTPGIIFLGGKWLLSNVSNRTPMSLSGGLVGYLGNNTEVGPYISLIFDNFFDVIPLFLEVGVDVVNHGNLQLQAGYYF